MYLIFKVLSYLFIFIFLMSIIYFFWLLFSGKTELKKDLLILFLIFILSVFSFFLYGLAAYKARVVYKVENIARSNFYNQKVIFKGMKDGNFVKNNSPKNSYFTYELNGVNYKSVISDELKEKIKNVEVGESVGGVSKSMLIILTSLHKAVINVKESQIKCFYMIEYLL